MSQVYSGVDTQWHYFDVGLTHPLMYFYILMTTHNLHRIELFPNLKGCFINRIF
jgi:hypothetical protein